MSGLRKGNAVAAGLPAFGGALFWLAVKSDHILHKQGFLSPRGAILVELIALVVAIAFFAVGVVSIVKSARAGRIDIALLTVASCALGLYLMVQGFDAGAALLYAT